jgi:hypothetical protein
LRQFFPFKNGGFYVNIGKYVWNDPTGNIYYRNNIPGDIFEIVCKFSLPRSIVTGQGTQIKTLNFIYQITDLTAMTSMTASLTRYSFSQGDPYPGIATPIAITTAPFVLGPTATLNSISTTVDTPSYDNQGAGEAITYNYVIQYVALSEDIEMTLYGMEVVFDQSIQPAVESLPVVTDADSPFAADAAESGKVIPVDSTGGAVSIELPVIIPATPADPTSIGCTITIKALVASTNPITVIPDATNRIKGLGLNAAGTVNKYYILNLPAANDYISLISDGDSSWTVTSAIGTWAREV